VNGKWPDRQFQRCHIKRIHANKGTYLLSYIHGCMYGNIVEGMEELPTMDESWGEVFRLE